jgi:hypothetical protein
MTYDEYVADMKREFPRLKIGPIHTHWFFGILWKMGWRMGGVTLYDTILLTYEIIGTQRAVEVLKHERVHMRDDHAWHIFYLLSYFLVLPVGPSFKAFWEWRGYRESIRSIWEGEYPPEYRQYLLDWNAEWIANQFCGASYLWMWPFRKMVLGWCHAEYARLAASKTV